MAVYISNDLRKFLPGLRVFSERVHSHVRNKRATDTRKKMPVDEKLAAASVLYIQSARYSRIVEMKEGSDSWERESSGLGSRERCYQCDEGTRRSLRIIESYDCLFRASAIRRLQLPLNLALTYQLIAPSFYEFPSANRQDDDITPGSLSSLPLVSLHFFPVDNCVL